MRLKVNELTRAEREGRTQRGKVAPADPALEEGNEVVKEEGSEEEDPSDEDGEHPSLFRDDGIEISQLSYSRLHNHLLYARGHPSLEES